MLNAYACVKDYFICINVFWLLIKIRIKKVNTRWLHKTENKNFKWEKLINFGSRKKFIIYDNIWGRICDCDYFLLISIGIIIKNNCKKLARGNEVIIKFEI